MTELTSESLNDVSLSSHSDEEEPELTSESLNDDAASAGSEGRPEPVRQSTIEEIVAFASKYGGKVVLNGVELTPVKRRMLEVVDVAALAARVAAEGPVRFMVAPLWPGDAYGEKKAGKTWADLDLAVSVRPRAEGVRALRGRALGFRGRLRG